jgi:hypothetical protein
MSTNVENQSENKKEVLFFENVDEMNIARYN